MMVSQILHVSWLSIIWKWWTSTEDWEFGLSPVFPYSPTCRRRGNYLPNKNQKRLSNRWRSSRLRIRKRRWARQRCRGQVVPIKVLVRIKSQKWRPFASRSTYRKPTTEPSSVWPAFCCRSTRAWTVLPACSCRRSWLKVNWKSRKTKRPSWARWSTCQWQPDDFLPLFSLCGYLFGSFAPYKIQTN